MSGSLLSTSFSQPIGSQVVAGALRGYYVDLRVTRLEPEFPPADLRPLDRQLHVDVAQWGLGAFERFLADEDERWLSAARGVGDYLAARQEREGRLRGGWVHRYDYPHTFPLRAPWLSAMAQGEGMSLLLRLADATGEERYAASAREALGPLDVASERGGVRTRLGDGPFLEEYPTKPASCVLNGAIFALWGCYDASLVFDDQRAGALFEEGALTLADNIGRWDTGSWSRYDLFPHPVPNLASAAYHTLHETQLLALNRLMPSLDLEPVAARFARYGESRFNRVRAAAAKVVFRLLVPRNPVLARRLPWTRAT